MKLALTLFTLFSYSVAFAQQPPMGLPMQTPTVPSEGTTWVPPAGPTPGPWYLPLPIEPKMAPPGLNSNESLSQLLQAQTLAIKELSHQLESLDERISIIEEGIR